MMREDFLSPAVESNVTAAVRVPTPSWSASRAFILEEKLAFEIELF
jgi:hypothetical protein